jgi:hypothetical protein
MGLSILEDLFGVKERVIENPRGRDERQESMLGRVLYKRSPAVVEIEDVPVFLIGNLPATILEFKSDGDAVASSHVPSRFQGSDSEFLGRC